MFWKWLNRFIKPCRIWIFHHVINPLTGKTLAEEISVQGYIGGDVPAMNNPSYRKQVYSDVKNIYCKQKNMPYSACFKR